jgi:hypothetical protein
MGDVDKTWLREVAASGIFWGSASRLPAVGHLGDDASQLSEAPSRPAPGRAGRRGSKEMIDHLAVAAVPVGELAAQMLVALNRVTQGFELLCEDGPRTDVPPTRPPPSPPPVPEACRTADARLRQVA